VLPAPVLPRSDLLPGAYLLPGALVLPVLTRPSINTPPRGLGTSVRPTRFCLNDAGPHLRFDVK
jgi:hypothetical protein